MHKYIINYPEACFDKFFHAHDIIIFMVFIVQCHMFGLGILHDYIYIILWAGALPMQSAMQNDMNIEDIEVPCGQPTTEMVSRVHVQNIPPEFRNIGLKYYLEKVMQNEVTCKVDIFNADAVAVFKPPIGKHNIQSLTVYNFYTIVLTKFKFFFYPL